MRPVLAYKIQEHAYGGLRPETQGQLRDVLKRLKPGCRNVEEASSRFKAGHESFVSGRPRHMRSPYA